MFANLLFMNVDVLLKDVRFFWILETELAKKLAKTGSQEYRFIEGCQNGLPGKLMVPKKLVTTEVTTTTRPAESLVSKAEVSKQVFKESMVSKLVSAGKWCFGSQGSGTPPGTHGNRSHDCQ